jgi:hypothetical protein
MSTGPTIFGLPIWYSNYGPASWVELFGAVTLGVVGFICWMVVMMTLLRIARFAFTGRF